MKIQLVLYCVASLGTMVATSPGTVQWACLCYKHSTAYLTANWYFVVLQQLQWSHEYGYLKHRQAKALGFLLVPVDPQAAANYFFWLARWFFWRLAVASQVFSMADWLESNMAG